MKTDDAVGEMVEFAPGGEHHCVGIVLRAWPSVRQTWCYECSWDDGSIEVISSEYVSFVGESVK